MRNSRELLAGPAVFLAAITCAWSACSSVYIPNDRWPSKTINVVLCADRQSDPKDAKRCMGQPLLDAPRAALVRQAIQDWNKTFSGHIEFKEVASYQKDVVTVSGHKMPGGCSTTHLGYVSEERDFVRIGTKCALQPATLEGSVLHEFGHVVGLEHEQRRPDRDRYITLNVPLLVAMARKLDVPPQPPGFHMNWVYQYHRLCDNFAPQACQPDFTIPGEPVSLFGAEYGVTKGDYDFGSVMAYPLYPPDSPKPGAGPTAQVVVGVTPAGAILLNQQHMTEVTVGQRIGLSAGDIAGVLAIYP